MENCRRTKVKTTGARTLFLRSKLNQQPLTAGLCCYRWERSHPPLLTPKPVPIHVAVAATASTSASFSVAPQRNAAAASSLDDPSTLTSRRETSARCARHGQGRSR
jgi:hypothetical protein